MNFSIYITFILSYLTATTFISKQVDPKSPFEKELKSIEFEGITGIDDKRYHVEINDHVNFNSFRITIYPQTIFNIKIRNKCISTTDPELYQLEATLFKFEMDLEYYLDIKTRLTRIILNNIIHRLYSLAQIFQFYLRKKNIEKPNSALDILKNYLSGLNYLYRKHEATKQEVKDFFIQVNQKFVSSKGQNGTNTYNNLWWNSYDQSINNSTIQSYMMNDAQETYDRIKSNSNLKKWTERYDNLNEMEIEAKILVLFKENMNFFESTYIDGIYKKIKESMLAAIESTFFGSDKDPFKKIGNIKPNDELDDFIDGLIDGIN